MEVEILHRPSYSLGVVRLAGNEKIRAEAGAMVSMTDGITIETKAAGGLLKSLTRSMLGGESFFQNFFQAPAQGGEITLAPDLPGDMELLELVNQKMMIQAGSYVASELSVELSAKVSMKAFVAAEGVSMLEATGSGKVLVSSYGAILKRQLQAGERYIVDTSHLVAFDGSMDVQVRTVGGFKSTLLSGEGLVVQITGPGQVWMQTRSPSALINWILPQIPRKD
ncbi:MAG: TIGR00266 family protein [Chloroflexota bacterium]